MATNNVSREVISTQPEARNSADTTIGGFAEIAQEIWKPAEKITSAAKCGRTSSMGSFNAEDKVGTQLPELYSSLVRNASRLSPEFARAVKDVIVHLKSRTDGETASITNGHLQTDDAPRSKGSRGIEGVEDPEIIELRKERLIPPNPYHGESGPWTMRDQYRELYSKVDRILKDHGLDPKAVYNPERSRISALDDDTDDTNLKK